MRGKSKCKILKEIRQKIADENDIPYVTRECTYQGECSGTCPKCEAELRYLESELKKREALGKSVAVAALCAGMAMSASACTPLDVPENNAPIIESQLSGNMALSDVKASDEADALSGEEVEPLAGDPVPEEPEVLAGEPVEFEPEEPEVLMGKFPMPPEEIEPLTGDVAYFPEEEPANE